MSGCTIPLSTLRKAFPATLFVVVSFAQAQIVSVFPQQNAVNIPATTNLAVTFSEAMNSGSLNDTTFRVWGMQSGLHRGSITYDLSRRQVTLIPAKPFAPGEIVSVVLSKAIRMASNQALTPFGWNFISTTNTGSGKFFHNVPYSVAGAPTSVYAADLDGDGDLDLVAGNFTSFSLSLLQNDGNGVFSAMQEYKIKSVPLGIVAADLDNDGDIDLAIARKPNLMSVLKNNANGTFAPMVDYIVGKEPKSLAAADLNGDGDIDLATTNKESDSVSILENNGNGVFVSKQDYFTPRDPTSIVIADLDGDGHQDLSVANFFSDSFSVFKNKGDGTFPTRKEYAAGLYPNSIYAVDLDGDLDVDIATAHQGANVISIFKNNGDGTFQKKKDYAAGSGQRAIFGADIDGDHDFDLITANAPASIAVLQNNGDGTFQPRKSYQIGSNPSALIAADFNNDMVVDLAAANYNDKNISVLPNPGMILSKIGRLDFEPVYVGQTQDRSFWVYNYAITSANIADISIGNPDFSVASSRQLMIAAGDSAKVTMRYTPTSAVKDTGVVTLYPNGFPAVSLALFGSGKIPAPSISATPTSLNFGNVARNKTAELTLNLFNTGVLDLNVTNVIHSNPNFAINGTIAFIIPPNRTQKITIRFTAPFLGNQSDTLKIFSTDPTNNPLHIPMSGNGVATAVAEHHIEPLPIVFALEQNHPNPFFYKTGASTTIRYALPRASEVILTVYDLAGREVITLVNAHKNAGYHDALWQGKDSRGRLLPNGVYWYYFETRDFVQARKIMFVR